MPETSEHNAAPSRSSTPNVAVLVVFYPWAFSGVCGGELNAVQAGLDDLVTDDLDASNEAAALIGRSLQDLQGAVAALQAQVAALEARLADRTRSDTRYFISSAPLTAAPVRAARTAVHAAGS